MKKFLFTVFSIVHLTAAQSLDNLGVEVHGSGRQYVFTNKEAGTYYGNVNAPNAGGWQGWFINAEKVVHDYSVSAGGAELNRGTAITTVFPDRIVRRYPHGIREQVTLLDSIDVLLIEINRPGATIGLIPAETFAKEKKERDRWKKIDPSPGSSVSVITAAIRSGRNSTVIAVAAGSSDREVVDAARRILRRHEDFVKLRRDRMQRILSRSSTRFNDPRLTKALGWAKLQIDALIMNQRTGGQRTKGIFAGLPWFNNYWGRDSFIALPGATYVTGNFDDARDVLLSYAAFQEKDSSSANEGRIPNLATPQSVIYNTADGTPWFVRSMYEYVKYSGDTSLIRELYPVLVRTIEGTLRHHTDSLGFLTHADAESWMDAVGPDGPWSPRGNRACDIQALWHQQLSIGVFCAAYLFDYDHAARWQRYADLEEKNFLRFFVDTTTMEIHDHLNVDGSPSTELRPNQLLAFDMMIPESARQRMVRRVISRLVYEHGTATLAQNDSNFHPYHEHPPYYVKDAAYHNGTIWTWLNGPMIYAATRYDLQETVFPVTENSVHQILERGCVGALSELLDVFPHRSSGSDSAFAEPKLSGTYSQAWSLSEFVRSIHQDYLGVSVDLPSHTLRINPKLPEKISSFETVQRIGNGSAGISFVRTGDSVACTIEPHDLDTAFGVNYFFVYPGGDAVQLPVELLPQTTLTIAHTPSAVTVLHGATVIFRQRNSPMIFLKNFSGKKYFTDISLARPDHDRLFGVLRGPSHPLLTRTQVRAASENAALLFSVNDPAGDDKGTTGTLRYPAGTHFRRGILDITGALFSFDSSNLYCTLTFADLYDPGWHPEYGFQLTLAAIAIRTGNGGQRSVGLNSNAVLDESRSFDRMIVVGGGLRVVDGSGAILCEYLPRAEDASDPIGSVQEKTIEFAIPLEYLGMPDGRWKMTILVGAQDDHGGAGIGEFREVNAEASEWQGGGKTKPEESHIYDSVLIN